MSGTAMAPDGSKDDDAVASGWPPKKVSALVAAGRPGTEGNPPLCLAVHSHHTICQRCSSDNAPALPSGRALVCFLKCFHSSGGIMSIIWDFWWFPLTGSRNCDTISSYLRAACCSRVGRRKRRRQAPLEGIEIREFRKGEACLPPN